MPGPSPVPCTFPDDFVQVALDTVRRRTVPVQDVQRFRLVLLLHEQPHMKNDKAAMEVGLSARQVQRWRSRWAAGDFSIEDQPGPGASPFFPPLDQALIQAMACEVVAETEEPLSRQSLADLLRRAERRWTKRSAAAPCGGCCMSRRSSRGSMNIGFFQRTRGLPRRLGRFSTCTQAHGKASRWGGQIMC